MLWYDGAMETEFTRWLQDQLKLRGWSNRELARRSGISHTWVNTILDGKHPDADFCIAIAESLEIDPIFLQRKAGLLSPEPGNTERLTLRELWQILNQMPDDQLSEVRRYARFVATDGKRAVGSRLSETATTGRIPGDPEPET